MTPEPGTWTHRLGVAIAVVLLVLVFAVVAAGLVRLVVMLWP